MPALPPDKATDEDIARSVQNGNIQQFGLLVERYEAKLQRYARKFLFNYLDTEDLLQEVFLKAYSHIQGFDTKRSFSSWIYRIAHNEFINAIKKRGQEPLPFFDADTIFPHPIARDDPFKDLDRKQTAELINQSLNKLDPKYRETLILYFLEGFDYETIADIMQIPKSTVGVRLSRGKAILKNFINHE